MNTDGHGYFGFGNRLKFARITRPLVSLFLLRRLLQFLDVEFDHFEPSAQARHLRNGQFSRSWNFEDGGVELHGLFGLVIELQEWGDFLHDFSFQP